MLTILLTILGLLLGYLAAFYGYANFAVCAATVTLGAVHLPEEQRRIAAEHIREALRMIGLPITTAARHYMDMDPAQFERALSGQAKLDWWRLELLPKEFKQCFALLKLRDLGMPSFVQAALSAVPVVASLRKEA